jgi:hypothetical protein
VRFSLAGFLGICLLGLTGCGHTPVSLTLFEVLGVGKNTDAIKLNTNLNYLRVSTPDRTVLMVLGYVDDLPEGPVQTWYSSAGEVLRLQNGRLISSAGLTIDWRQVAYEGLPSWRDMLAQSNAQYVRVRDEMPNYRFGIRENLNLYSVPVPSNSRLKGLQPSLLRWYEEAPRASGKVRPTARYGIDFKNSNPVVIYGEQCFADNRCISWQTWPAS